MFYGMARPREYHNTCVANGLSQSWHDIRTIEA
jgi:hypothetical protein